MPMSKENKTGLKAQGSNPRATPPEFLEEFKMPAHASGASKHLEVLAYWEEKSGNISIAKKYRTIASAIETRYQALKRIGEK